MTEDRIKPLIIVVGNYPPTEQWSMQRFAEMVWSFRDTESFDVIFLKPERMLLMKRTSQSGFLKWIGYIDNYLIFPIKLRRMIGRERRKGRNQIILHICDHSNAPFFYIANQAIKLLTCHDLIAIHASMNQVQGIRVGLTGKLLQKIIARSIFLANQIVSVSKETSSNLVSTLSIASDKIATIPNCFNAEFKMIDLIECDDLLSKSNLRPAWLKIKEHPFLFNISGNGWYKNRTGLIHIYAKLRSKNKDAPPLVIAGASPEPQLLSLIEEWNLKDYVHFVGRISHQELEALYSSASLFIFPSLMEGFGWPPLEASACGCQVIASDIYPIKQFAVPSTVFADPRDVSAFAEAIEKCLIEKPNDSPILREEDERHLERFMPTNIARQYNKVYQRLLRNS